MFTIKVGKTVLNLKRRFFGSIYHYIISYNDRDVLAESDVSDEVFEVYKSQFIYNEYPLEVDLKTLTGYDTAYVVERFEMQTPYKNDEHLHGYIVWVQFISAIYAGRETTKVNRYISFVSSPAPRGGAYEGV